MQIPEQVLHNMPLFVLVRNLQPALNGIHIGCVDLAASSGEYIASGKAAGELGKLIPAPELPADPEKRREILARNSLDEDDVRGDPPLSFHSNLDDHDDYEMFGVSYAIVLLGRGEGDVLIDFIVGSLLEKKRQQGQLGGALDLAPLIVDPSLLTRPDQVLERMLVPSNSNNLTSRKIDGADLWRLWEDYVYRIVWWSGAAPDDLINRLTKRINAQPYGITDTAWEDLQEWLSK